MVACKFALQDKMDPADKFEQTGHQFLLKPSGRFCAMLFSLVFLLCALFPQNSAFALDADAEQGDATLEEISAALQETLSEALQGTTLEGVFTSQPKTELSAQGAVVGKRLYRLYNRWSGEHFFTSDANEVSHLVSLGWNDEGVGWVSPNEGSAVYRLYNRWSGDHHFTTSIDERDACVAAGWNDEGTAFHSPSEGLPVYRLYNKYVKSFYHHYTTSESEYQACLAAGWMDEGIGWYGYNPDAEVLDSEPPSYHQPSAPPATAPQTFSLMFDSNGGTGYMEPQEVNSSASSFYIKNNAFRRRFFSFAGWNTQPDGSGVAVRNLENMFNAARTLLDAKATTLYAQWNLDLGLSEYYTVVFVDLKDNKRVALEVNIDDDDFILTPETTGFSDPTIHGWCSQSDGLGQEYSVGTRVRSLAGADETVYLYAKRLRPEWANVSYDSNGGNWESGLQMKEKNYRYENLISDSSKIIDVSSEIYKPGSDFLGWSRSATDASNLIKTNGDLSAAVLGSLGAPVTLYAHWKVVPNTYDVRILWGAGTKTSPCREFTFRVDKNYAFAILEYAQEKYAEARAQNPGLPAEPWRPDGDLVPDVFFARINETPSTYAVNQEVSNIVEEGNLAELTLLYKKAVYDRTIEFEGNGATGGFVPNKTFDINKAEKLPSSLYVRTGYVFNSWNTKADGTGKKFSEEERVTLSTCSEPFTKLYAQWTPFNSSSNTFKIIYEPNGAASFSSVVKYYNINDLRNDILVLRDPFAYGSNQNNNPDTLIGWNTKPDCSGTAFSDGILKSDIQEEFIKFGKSEIILYADWRKNDVETFDVVTQWGERNGEGEFPSVRFSVHWKDRFNVLERAFGAYKAGGGSSNNPWGRVGFRADSFSIVGTWTTTRFDLDQLVEGLCGPRTLLIFRMNYVKADSAAPKTFSVNFNGNGSTSGSMAAQEVAFNSYVTLRKNEFARKYHVFTEWNTKADGSGKSYQDGASVFNAVASGESLSLYAQWEKVADAPTTYKVIFNGNGAGIGSMLPIEVNVDEFFELPPQSFAKSGMTFKGWNTNPAGTGVSYIDRGRVINIASPGETLTLYVQWEVIPGQSYSISFSKNEHLASGSMKMQKAYRGTPVALNPNMFSHPTMIFVGWNTKADGTGVSYADRAQVLDLIYAGGIADLYAQWKMKAGYQSIGGKRYYVKEDGTYYKGWLKVATDQYRYFDTDGAMVQDREFNVPSSNTALGAGCTAGWHYFLPDGIAKFGWHMFPDRTIKFYDITTGVRWASNEYYVTMLNKVEKDPSPGWYSFDGNGFLQYGWITRSQGGRNVKKYYATENGKRLQGGEFYISKANRTQNETNPGWVRFNNEGDLLYGWQGSPVKYYGTDGKRWHGQRYVNGNAWVYFTGGTGSNGDIADPNNPGGGTLSYGFTNVKQDGRTVIKCYDKNGVRLVSMQYLNRGGVVGWYFFLGTNNPDDRDGGVMHTGYANNNKDYYDPRTGVKTNPPAAPAPSAHGMNSSEYALARAIFDSYNNFRASKGLNRVAWNDECANMAYGCVSGNRTHGEGKPFKERMVHGLGIPDNLRKSRSDILYKTIAQYDANSLVCLWSTSTGHRKMMQCATATMAGVAVCRDSRGFWYYAIVYNFSGYNQSGS